MASQQHTLACNPILKPEITLAIQLLCMDIMMMGRFYAILDGLGVRKSSCRNWECSHRELYYLFIMNHHIVITNTLLISSVERDTVDAEN